MFGGFRKLKMSRLAPFAAALRLNTLVMKFSVDPNPIQSNRGTNQEEKELHPCTPYVRAEQRANFAKGTILDVIGDR